MLTTILKSFDTFVVTTSSSITSSLKGFGLTVIPTSTATACGLTISNKIVYAIVMQKYKKYKKHYKKDQQTIKSIDHLYGKILQGNVIDKKENEFFLLKVWKKLKMILFINLNSKKIKFFWS